MRKLVTPSASSCRLEQGMEHKDCVVIPPYSENEQTQSVSIYIYICSCVCVCVYIYIYIYTGLFKMTVRVLTTCHTQYT